ncbi:MAG: lipopolysaccharide biosynthesis protein [Oceanococcus sp.]|nr:MAG: lipopolysaccharide biosynthesis protein [Oceanococcus sp.]
MADGGRSLSEQADHRASVAGEINAARAISGGTKLLAARLAAQFIRLAFTVVLARILAPQDYGLVASVQVITGLAVLLQDMGLSAATLQRKHISEAQIHALYWLNLLLGGCVAGLGLLSAPYIAAWLRSPDSVGVIQVLLVAVLIPSASAQHRALMQRELRFGAIALSSVCGTLIGGACAVMAAVAGAGPWALVLMMVVADAVALIISWAAARYHPGIPKNFAGVASLLHFGGGFLMFRVLGHFAQNLHLLLLSRNMGFAAAGQFTRAHMLTNMASGYVNEPAGKVALPMLSRLISEPRRFVRFYDKATGVMMLAAAPLGVMGVLYGSQVIHVLLGEQWEAAEQIFQVLCFGLIAQPLMYSTGWLYMARGDMRGMLIWGCIGWGAMLIAALVALRFGPLGVAWAWSGTQWVLLVPCLVAAYRHLPLRTSVALLRASRPVAAALVAAVLVKATFSSLTGLPMWAELIGATALFGPAYLLLAWFVFGQRQLMQTLAETIFKRIQSMQGRR